MRTDTEHPEDRERRRLGARELARAKREAMALRARRIRTWVALGAVTLFIAAFLVVYVQLASGHDPALVASAERRAARASGTTGSASSSGSEHTETGSGAEESSESDSSGESSSSSESGSSAGEPEVSEPSGLSTSQS